MAKVLITEQILYNIANAIRFKLGVTTKYLPSQMPAAILSIKGGETPSSSELSWISSAEVGTAVLPIKNAQTSFDLPDSGISGSAEAWHKPGTFTIVPWATGTDAEIAAMIDALDHGAITLADTLWQIGDERQVTLSAMAATGVGEAHAAQTVTLVLMDSRHYDLANGRKDNFVVGLKGCLAEPGYMNATATNTGSWSASARRAWCNEVFRAAIPATLRACFKPFRCVTAASFEGSSVEVSNDYFALFAEKEIFGERAYSNPVEAGTLSQISYYATAANRVKQRSGAAAAWFERSPHSNDRFCAVGDDGSGGYHAANDLLGLAPFGCI